MNAEHLRPEDIPPALEEAVAAVRRPAARNSRTRTAVVLGALAVILTAIAILFITNLQQNAVRDDQIAKLATANNQQKQATDKANDRLKDAGLPTVPAPGPVNPTVGAGARGIPGAPGINGVDGRPGPPGAESTVAGPRGADGSDGADSDVAGPPGLDGADSDVPGPAGADGADGADSDVAGPQGEPGKDGADSNVPGPAGADGREVKGLDCVDNRSVITYTDDTAADVGACQTKGDVGDRGEPGEAGAPGVGGKDGRGIASLDCTDNRLVATYTDDTTDDVGSCTP